MILIEMIIADDYNLFMKGNNIVWDNNIKAIFRGER